MKPLIDILTRYEGAVNAAEVDGDESALGELEAARADLMEVLQLARRWEETNNLLHQNNLDAMATTHPDGTGYSL